MIKRNQIDKIVSSGGGGDATAANQILEIAELIAVNNKLLAQATAANQVTEIAELTAINTKLLAQATANNQIIGNSTLATISNNINTQLTLLQTQNRFNNGLTSTSFTAGNIVLLNTAIQTFITANTLRQFRNISIGIAGGQQIAILIHSL